MAGITTITTSHTNLKPSFQINGNTRNLTQYIFASQSANKRNLVTSAWVKTSDGNAEPVLVYDIVPHIQAVVLYIKTIGVATTYPPDRHTTPPINWSDNYETFTANVTLRNPVVTSTSLNNTTQISINRGTGYGGSLQTSTTPVLLLDNGLLIPVWDYPPEYSCSFQISTKVSSTSGTNIYWASFAGYAPLVDDFETPSASASQVYSSSNLHVGSTPLYIYAFGPSINTQLTLSNFKIANKTVPIIITNANTLPCHPNDQSFILDNYAYFFFPSGNTTTWDSWIHNTRYSTGTTNPIKSSRFGIITLNGSNVICDYQNTFPKSGSYSIVYTNQACTIPVKSTDIIIANHHYYTIPFNSENWRTSSIIT